MGTEIGGYRITGLIGQGGMGTVYLAEAAAADNPVALKVLAPELASDEQFRRRFLREARYARSLDHPNVVPVHDAGESEGLLFIAMSYVQGMDLSTVLGIEGALVPSRALHILSQVASALDAAHATGLMHRDVKPGNVLIDSVGGSERCYLTDFGLSKNPTQDSGALTAIGDFVGTYLYTAPEQILGQEIDGRADLYSLGCVLFEMLTGEPPFSAPTEAEVLQAHFETPPPPASEVRTTLPSAVDEVIATAMAKDPSERFGTGADLAAAAARALGTSAEASPAVSEVGEAGATTTALTLEVTGGPAAGTRLRVDQELLIGRDAAGSGTLGGDAEISRRHARIRRDSGGAFAIEDLDSTNGTFVNGDPVTARRVIRAGDTIELGGTTIVVGASVPDRGEVSVQLSIDRGGRVAALWLDERSDPIRIALQDGRWRFAERR